MRVLIVATLAIATTLPVADIAASSSDAWQLANTLPKSRQPAPSTALFDTPVYNPETKSYFALIRFPERDEFAGSKFYWLWSDAAEEAAKRVYKGTQGRLAVIKSRETRDFLLYTFRTDSAAWIGLSYECDRRTLRWSDGSTMEPGDFAAWDPNWDASSGTCTSRIPSERLLGVLFTSNKQGFRWIAYGYQKGFHRYFVEFPTGKP